MLELFNIYFRIKKGPFMFALVFHYELVIIRICDIKLLGIKMYEQNRPIAQTRTQYFHPHSLSHFLSEIL